MSADALHELGTLVGTDQVLRGEACARYEVDERGLFHGRALAVVRPADTEQVARVVRCCVSHRLAIVPHGGNTGYCGGATADRSGTQLVLSLERMNRVLAVDADAHTMTAQAGVTLAAAQAAAEQHGRLLPLAMGSQGSCQLGGNLSTNAGGLAVLKYGTMRDLALGLEVVLPDGRVLDRLTSLRKDNTGYDLKQLFIGAEGTLGIITTAVLKLFPAAPRNCAWVSIDTPAAALPLLSALRELGGDAVTSFEYMSGEALALVADTLPELRAPLRAEHHVLVEMIGSEHDEVLERTLAAAHERDLLHDVVLAQNESQRRQLWRLRESIPAAEKRLGGSVKHDVSVPLADVADYIGKARGLVLARWPGVRLSVYGHVGDGNVHFNVLAPTEADAEGFKQSHGDAISEVLHDLAHAMRGSFSAEHGVGVLKRDMLQRYGDPVALSLMRQLKHTLDPLNLMNPGKLLAPVRDAG
ncbi:MAG: FAD-binding oxidoreductase [Proteobacteria bacterium]|nr:FAD-binding oxidoreductase [Pseudomonadota bacterium]